MASSPGHTKINNSRFRRWMARQLIGHQSGPTNGLPDPNRRHVGKGSRCPRAAMPGIAPGRSHDAAIGATHRSSAEAHRGGTLLDRREPEGRPGRCTSQLNARFPSRPGQGYWAALISLVKANTVDLIAALWGSNRFTANMRDDST